MTPKQKLDALVELFTPQIRDAFLASIQGIVNNVILKDVIEAIENGDIEQAFRALGFSEAAMRPLTKIIEEAFETGGVLMGETFPKYLQTTNGRAVFRFDIRNSRAEAWLRDHSSRLVTNIGEDIRIGVRNILTDGMRQGDNPRRTALDIVGRIDSTTGKRTGGIVGLAQNQERWVASARRRLTQLDPAYLNMGLRNQKYDSIVNKAIASGKPLSADIIDKLTNAYTQNTLRYRGESIGRTEAIQSLNRSEYEATKQAVDLGALQASAVRRHWDSAGDSRVRYSHKKMDKKYEKEGVGLDEPFVSPSGARMMHPGDTSLGAGGDEIIMCRCRIRMKVDFLSTLTDDD